MKLRFSFPNSLRRCKALLASRRGFTLVEMVTAVAILGIVMVMLTGFLRGGGQLYHRVSCRLALQVQTQLLLSRMQEYLMDANGGLVLDEANNILYIFEQRNGEIRRRSFRLEKDGILYFRNEAVSSLSADFTEGGVDLAGNLNCFYMTITTKPSAAGDDLPAGIAVIETMTLTMDMTLENAANKSKLLLAPRNPTVWAKDTKTMLDFLQS